MKKIDLIRALEKLKVKAEDDDVQQIYALLVIDTLLDYIGDHQIREAVEEIPL